MGNIFNPDSRFTHYANKFSDLVTLNLWFVLTSIPLVSIGASATAMHYVLLKIYRDELEYSVTKSYFHAFKGNFFQSTIIWFLYMIVTAMIFVDLHLVNLNIIANSLFMKIILIVTSLVILFSLTWIFPLQSRYDNPVLTTIRNALVIGILNPVKTALMCVVMVFPIYLLITKPSTIPVILICGFSLLWIICTMFYHFFFIKNESKSEQKID